MGPRQTGSGNRLSSSEFDTRRLASEEARVLTTIFLRTYTTPSRSCHIKLKPVPRRGRSTLASTTRVQTSNTLPQPFHACPSAWRNDAARNQCHSIQIAHLKKTHISALVPRSLHSPSEVSWGDRSLHMPIPRRSKRPGMRQLGFHFLPIRQSSLDAGCRRCGPRHLRTDVCPRSRADVSNTESAFTGSSGYLART